MRRLRPQRLNTPEGATPSASHAAPRIRVERDIMITGAYSPETSLRPPSYCLQRSTIVSHASPSTSLEPGTLSTTAVHQVKEAAPPIPEKSSARLSMHRKSWGPATTLSSYIDSAALPKEKGAVTKHHPQPRYKFPLQEKERLPRLPPPLFSESRGIPPIPEIITPASSTSCAQRSPRTFKLSPWWNPWPSSPIIGPSPPDSPVEDLPQTLQPPPMWQSRYSDYEYRHYSV